MKRKLHSDGQKHCARCDSWLALGNYHRNKRQWDGLHAYCKQCMAAGSLRRYENERDRLLALGRIYRAKNRRKRNDARMRSRFGISLEEYEIKLKQQNGLCAICRKVGKKALHIDHSHRNNQNRGLLCFRCNVALGSFGDSIEILGEAISYLQKYAA